MQAFLLGWDWHCLRASIPAIFNAPIFFPESNTLTYMDHMIGETILAAPVLSTWGIPAAYNSLFFLSFVASGWIVYLLARAVGISQSGAFLSGAFFAFGPYRLANLDLLNQLQTEFIPLGVLFGFKYLHAREWRYLVGLALVLVLQAYFGWYYFYYLMLALALLVGYEYISRRLQFGKHDLGAILMAGLLFAVAVLPIALPYIREHRALPEFHRSLGESALYSADVTDYFKVNPTSRVTQLVPFPAGRQAYLPGIPAVILAVLSAWELWRRCRGATQANKGNRSVLRGLTRIPKAFATCAREHGYFVVLACSSLVLSLGPILQIAGVRVWVPLPYAVAYYVVPGVASMRAPARLAVLVLLGTAVVAGFGFDKLRRGWSASHKRALFLGVTILTLALVWPGALSVVNIPKPGEEPAVYRWLADVHDRSPVLEIPVPLTDADENQTHALRQLYCLYHGHPRLDGTSGFLSKRYHQFRNVVQGFPNEEALRACKGMGAKLVIVHYGDYSPARRGVIEHLVAAESQLALRARFGSDVVYALGVK
jgi:hypothetical protein